MCPSSWIHRLRSILNSNSSPPPSQNSQFIPRFNQLTKESVQGMIKGKAPFLRLQTRTKTQLQSVCQAAMSTNNISFSQVMKLTYPMLVPKLATTTII
ncbi:hypothetical protein HanRHA438_Chr12g0559091 [Helianthus annuus]|nr:hypothetical protein HanRHA438_Chr12g0559091 [Helianthus annuus]